MGDVDVNGNVILSHHLHVQAVITDCIPFYLDEQFMKDHTLRPVDAATVPKNLKMLLDTSGLGSFFCSGNYECRLGASKFASPSCCCCCCSSLAPWWVGRSWQVFFAPKFGDDENDAAGCPVRTVKLSGQKGDPWENPETRRVEYSWWMGGKRKPEKVYSPSWHGWTAKHHQLRMSTGSGAVRYILAETRGSREMCLL